MACAKMAEDRSSARDVKTIMVFVRGENGSNAGSFSRLMTCGSQSNCSATATSAATLCPWSARGQYWPLSCADRVGAPGLTVGPLCFHRGGCGRTPQDDLAGQSTAGDRKVGVRILRLPEGMAADDAVGGEVTYSWGGTTLILVRKDANLGVYGW